MLIKAIIGGNKGEGRGRMDSVDCMPEILSYRKWGISKNQKNA
jgi:hypothetical protein